MKALVLCDLGHKVREEIRHQVGTLIIRPDEFSSIVDEELRKPQCLFCGRDSVSTRLRSRDCLTSNSLSEPGVELTTSTSRS